MFKKPEAAIQKDLDTLIGPNSVFKGNIESGGSVRIDGVLKGNLDVRGDVIIGKDGEVQGNIEADNIFISGAVDGNVTTTGMLKLFSTARLHGDIIVSSFVSDIGGVFHGQCNMLIPDNSETQSVKTIAKNTVLSDFKKSTLITETGDEKATAAGQ